MPYEPATAAAIVAAISFAREVGRNCFHSVDLLRGILSAIPDPTEPGVGAVFFRRLRSKAEPFNQLLAGVVVRNEPPADLYLPCGPSGEVDRLIRTAESQSRMSGGERVQLWDLLAAIVGEDNSPAGAATQAFVKTDIGRTIQLAVSELHAFTHNIGTEALSGQSLLSALWHTARGVNATASQDYDAANSLLVTLGFPAPGRRYRIFRATNKPDAAAFLAEGAEGVEFFCPLLRSSALIELTRTAPYREVAEALLNHLLPNGLSDPERDKRLDSTPGEIETALNAMWTPIPNPLGTRLSVVELLAVSEKADEEVATPGNDVTEMHPGGFGPRRDTRETIDNSAVRERGRAGLLERREELLQRCERLPSVPKEPQVVVVPCRHCWAGFRLPSARVGQRTRCTFCGHGFVVAE